MIDVYYWPTPNESARVLTGERRPYDTECACFGRLAPHAPFSWSAGTLGAFELAARLSWLDLADGPVHGGRMLTFNASAIWTWNAFVRVHAGYVYAHVADRGAYGANHILQTRLELQL